VTTDRCIINLPENEQKEAINHCLSLVKKGGLFLMCECHVDGLKNMNELRKSMGVSEFEPPWTCHYLNFEVPCTKIENFASTYYLITRGLIAHDHEKYPEIKEKALNLPSIGNWAPITLFVFER
jgi:hypothetical protein